MRKGVHNIRSTLCNIMIRRLICFLIRIVWLRRYPILAPGSDVRALAVPLYKGTKRVYSYLCKGKYVIFIRNHIFLYTSPYIWLFF
jgi:hypothetical protein